MTDVQDDRGCGNCGALVAKGHHHCGSCGLAFSESDEEASRQTLFFGALMAPGRAKLILIKGTASSIAGLSFHLNATNHVAGSEEGTILFTDDSYLSAKHANFYYHDNLLYLNDLGSKNGTFKRLDEAHRLEDGDEFQVGGQLLRFELLNVEGEANGTNGVSISTSPFNESKFRVVQLFAGGLEGQVYSSPNNSLILGREGCDMNFASDRNVSRKHAKIVPNGEGFLLIDDSSHNGTFVRIREDVHLAHGDYVALGQHLLRVEINA